MPAVQDVISEIKNLNTPEEFESKRYLSNDSDKKDESCNSILRDCVRSVLTSYIDDLDGHAINDLYQLVLAEVETPLLETILEHTRGNQSKAAQILGINRGTLRKKLKQYNISE
ncbi:MAG: DNA-binding transcriptional regulator Fis [gamma proteobacterium symbiont of Bathyaustriella thionipta]|nr:DNA-binding transcriptional regulator Fis [gamma proteobacterium symbiont of Bathyaustriella thionipta]MCU7951209.1 DNA-binding transcriptional regulator Fis [gamma proteobacterium symbiont of Bathyaustriella thionipta]MCU7953591.1 DNA-binding transcriptional regulator Fis [gamma proteobacterium symbiont of Bathyaustriella thionipta]MCU7957730.1 DNA-binding transcriptional regulator Fis [gamma proteobacterium symbiont of Bathyaustriella thionipta]MCU7966401.1 DNA-binding transcriptional regu